MLTTTVLLWLCATPVKVAATGFAVSGEDKARAEIWLERVAEVMRRSGRVEVTTPADLAQLLGMERQKQLLGCEAEATSCMTELANALGTTAVLSGSITRSGDDYLAVLKVLRQHNGSVLWSASGRMSKEPALLDWLDAQALAAVDALAPRAPPSAGPLVLGAASVAALGAGATLLVLSNTVALQSVRDARDEPALVDALAAGRGQGTAGVVLLSVGGAAAVAAVVWLVAAPASAPPAVALAPVPGGAVVSWGARF